jgi:hypothetical protein
MTPSPPIDDRSDTRYSGRLAAGSDQTRSGPLNGPAVTPPIGSCNMRSTHLHRGPTASITLKRMRQPQRSDRKRPKPAAKSP